MAEAELPRHYSATGEEPWVELLIPASSQVRVNPFTPSVHTTPIYVIVKHRTRHGAHAQSGSGSRAHSMLGHQPITGQYAHSYSHPAHFRT